MAEGDDMIFMINFDFWINHEKYATGLGFTISREYYQLQVKFFGKMIIDLEWWKAVSG